jgi:hypothetical protein
LAKKPRYITVAGLFIVELKNKFKDLYIKSAKSLRFSSGRLSSSTLCHYLFRKALLMIALRKTLKKVCALLRLLAVPTAIGYSAYAGHTQNPVDYALAFIELMAYLHGRDKK